VFQFASLIPGKYRLTATMTDLKSGTPFKVTKNIEVAQAPLTDLVVKIAAGGTVRVVVSAKEGEAPPRLALALVRREEAEDPGRPFVPLRFSMEDTKTYEFHNVAPGEYVLLLGSSTRPDTRRFFLEAVTEGTKDVQEDGVVVPEGLGTVELSAVVNTHGGIVNGVAMDSKRHPVLGRAIVLVSADRGKRTLRHYSMVSWTDGGGAFHFTGLIPGEYLAVLWTGGDPGEAQNPAYFDEVEHNAAPVHVPPDGEVTFGLRSAGTEK
jgi:hypothetical protein